MADLVPSSVLEGSIDLIRQADRDPTEFVLAAGLPLDALHSPHTLINSIAFSRLLEIAAKELDEQFLGLKVSNIQGLDSSGSLWLVARNARTVGEELVVLADNMALHTGLVSANVAAENPVGKLVTINFYTPVSARLLAAKQQIRQVQIIELFFGATISELRRSLGKQWRPDYVQFMHAAPSASACHKSFRDES